jgi:hypothetical protein
VADHVALAAAHEQCRNRERRGRAVQAFMVGDLARAALAHELRVPMPAVAAVGMLAHDAQQAFARPGPLAVRGVGLDRGRDLVEAVEAVRRRDHPGADPPRAFGLTSTTPRTCDMSHDSA